MKFRVSKNCDYVQGHLRCGHAETIVECDSREELDEIIYDREFKYELDVIVDDYEIDHYELSDEDYIIEEVK